MTATASDSHDPAAGSYLVLRAMLDERCAGFFALGAAKASGMQVALTCTSGTAAANVMPAVIDAHEAAVPLILLTADRSPELRDVGAGQAIDQIKLYGDSVKWFVERGVPEATPERLRWVRALDCRAYWTAAVGRPGSVHISDWLDCSMQPHSAVAHAIAGPLTAAGLSGPATITALEQSLPPSATLFIDASIPIRDAEEFFPALNEPPGVMANRRVNGIDRTVSTGFGVAAAGGGPVVLALGDLTRADDIGGLLAARRLGLELTIVLINNDGSGIFNLLPVSAQGEVFEQHIATPAGLDFADAAALYGFRHQPAATLHEFAGALMAALTGTHSAISGVRGDCPANRHLRAETDAETEAIA